MAEKKTTKPSTDKKELQQKPKRKRKFIKAFLAILVLFLLAAGIGYGGVYFKFIDVPQLAERFKLYDYPVLNRYFQKPATNFEMVDIEDPTKDQAPFTAAPAVPQAPAAAAPAATQTNGQPADAANKAPDKDQLAKLKQEEAKRISKLARLYGEMKPDEAVPILNQLDDPTVISILNKMEDDQVAKILSQMDAKRAARLTQDMLKGKSL